MTSRLISARISVERMFASSASAFRPWIALRSCASSKEYSAFESSVTLAVTVTFSIENAISLEMLLAPSPSPSASPVVHTLTNVVGGAVSCCGTNWVQEPGLLPDCESVVPKPTACVSQNPPVSELVVDS